jgi:hypothetical protein
MIVPTGPEPRRIHPNEIIPLLCLVYGILQPDTIVERAESRGEMVNLHRVARRIATALLFFSLTSLPQAVCAQVPTLKHAQLPSSVRLTDVEIRLVTGGGDGCVGRCVNYRIIVRGDRTVELEDVGSSPTAKTQKRSIAEGEVVALVNEFFKARFFDALDTYAGTSSVVLKGESLLLLGHDGGTRGWVEITMTLGSATKTVRLQESVPVELERLKDLVWRIGGPEAWSVK